MGQLDADALEREGWSLCRTFQKDKDTMVYEVKKPSDFSTIEERKTGKWEMLQIPISPPVYKCSVCDSHALPPAQPNVPDTNVGDTISRQAVINIVVFECGEWTGLAKEISKQLRQLSSAQPDIIRCKDCKHWRSNTEFCSTFTELNVAHRMPPNGFCSCAERLEE